MNVANVMSVTNVTGVVNAMNTNHERHETFEYRTRISECRFENVMRQCGFSASACRCLRVRQALPRPSAPPRRQAAPSAPLRVPPRSGRTM